MSLSRRLLLITFLESFSCILVERGIYFFCHERLGFSDRLNLWLALAFGLSYVAGAIGSHRLSIRLSEKRLLGLTIAGQFAFHVLLAIWPRPVPIFIGSSAIGWLNGAKWPLVESYVSAGRSASATARAVGRFNIAWSSAVPLSLLVVGPMIRWGDGSLFVLAAVLNLASLGLILPLARQPVHLPHDHPERPSAQAIVRLRAMLGFSRWTMFASYASLWVLAALMPRIFSGPAPAGFDLSVAAATGLSGIVDAVRVGAFVLLTRTAGWHNRWGPLALSLAGLPVGFVMVLLGPNLAVVIAGEVVFGLAAGMTYYAALYYAMVVANASVDAGGAHEGLIGMGFALGPVAALAGSALAPVLNGPPGTGVLVGVTPLFAICAAGAILAAVRGRPARSPATATVPPA